jgi:hypothetical protein
MSQLKDDRKKYFLLQFLLFRISVDSMKLALILGRAICSSTLKRGCTVSYNEEMK